jgi:hypothetical protein
MLDALGQRYGVRPSVFLGIDDDWLAYQVDVMAASAASSKKKKFHKAAAYQKPMATQTAKIDETGVW